MTQTHQDRGLAGAYFRGVHAFFTVAVLAGGGMFFFKLYSFMKTIKRDELAGFAFDPIMIYGFVAMGFLCLLGWAYSSGQFRDVERAKFEMLEKFEAQVRAEAGLTTEEKRRDA
ncbi:MAG: nitrogen fixation-related uncharacterized protein [Planctomycetota bacterium]|jgi:nitrogen fixation-related uncharacterized protein